MLFNFSQCCVLCVFYACIKLGSAKSVTNDIAPVDGSMSKTTGAVNAADSSSKGGPNLGANGGTLSAAAASMRNGCASPEVLVNGAPSPEIVDTVGGGTGTGFANIQEIQFVGVVGPTEQKRICKIKCLNGVWVGPLCALEHGK